MKKNIHDKINSKSSIVGIIGLGYVGLPLAVQSAKKGYTVIGFENNVERVNKINKGINYVGDVVENDFLDVVNSGKFTATTDKNQLSKCDIVLICVPTPLNDKKLPDMSYIHDAEKDIAFHIHQDMLIVLESTTYPGTTDEELKMAFEKNGLKCGIDFYLAFSAERVDPGNEVYQTYNIPKVIGGVTDKCSEIAEAFYKSILDCDTFRVSSCKVAEMTKLLENTYRNINIALVNQLTILCDKMDINVWEVIEAAKTKPFGFQAFYPGPGVGGHCIPLDPYYLSWKADQIGFDFSLIKTSCPINDKMPLYIIERVKRLLSGKPLSEAKILISGIAYKADIDDHRESPALEIITLLEDAGTKVYSYDPHVSAFKIGKKKYITEAYSDTLIKSVDLVIVTTGHTKIDYESMQKNAKMIFDTRNALKNINRRDNIELL